MTPEFCENCGIYLTTRRREMPFVILKVGTLGDPSLYGASQMAILTVDKQRKALLTLERMPPR